MNKVAKKVSELEGKKIQVNIAQIKEVIKCFLLIVANEYPASDVLALVERYQGK